ncbi:hypothetical protein SEA_KOZIE_57 [Microbacterium phage Kozie]|uniref:Uncharacterized protein n=1 Tax=Microbacterium phage Kozie TaxID=2885981 RepID=A0AAE8Y894_9CAUD|nr:hypothetical protein QC998_gp57 [Microbacterium phage Kozie]UDL16253.1 hypothetical protein SEA_KOZIE_57 [Microbacterium phage Kozie]
MTDQEIEHTPDDDVLEPFEEEQAARRAQAARDAARLAREEQLRADRVAPRIDRARRVGGAPALVLVRSDDLDARPVTVWFTDAEWSLIRRRVLAEHDLSPLEE